MPALCLELMGADMWYLRCMAATQKQVLAGSAQKQQWEGPGVTPCANRLEQEGADVRAH